MNVDRRRFLAWSVAAALTPRALAAPRRAAGRGRGDGRALVVLQLSGGNDGLSTLVPYAHDAYRRARTTTRHEPGAVLKIDDAFGLHPACVGLKRLYDAGRLAIVRGVGYPEPNRSHFESLEIWHAADPRGRDLDAGWIGRYADLLPEDERVANAVVHVGGIPPFSVAARRRPATSFALPETYRRTAGEAESRALVDVARREGTAGRDAALERIRRTMAEAEASSAAIRAAAAAYRPRAEYPRTPLGASLRAIAALVAGNVGTRVYSAETGGFDTHVGQRPRHDALMAGLSEALDSFWRDLDAGGRGDRVAVLVFSEFGRRLAENASGGTDHGAAGVALVLGGPVQGGLYGAPPDLDDLDRGDPKFTTDFRSVYASLLEGVLGADADRVLGASFPRLPFA